MIAQGLFANRPGPVGVAVSGGGDSMALLHLAAEQARTSGHDLRAVTVNHGLRPEAAQEADFVAETCAALGVPHDILAWRNEGPEGNLQDQARRARYRLMTDWAKAHGVGAVALAHTMDDQAETVLMRLVRQSGVDGLSGMAPLRQVDGVDWVRPLLGARRADLRAFLQDKGLRWCEDPSNEDRRFDRIRMRDALAQLAPLGIDTPSLAGVAANMAVARAALEVQTLAAARAVATVDRGDVVIETKGFAALPVEIQRRLLQHALIWISGADYPPRATALQEFRVAALAGVTATLQGCLALPGKGTFRLLREAQAVRDTVAEKGALWDGRWRLSNLPNGAQVRALGETGLALCPDWRETGLPRLSLLASPAVWAPKKAITVDPVLWYEGTLVSAPLAGHENGCRAELAQGDDSFYSLIISH